MSHEEKILCLADKIKNALEKINILAGIDASGRSGNLFFLTLFDKHPEIACCPVYQYSYSYFETSFPSKKIISLSDANDFVKNTSYSRLLYALDKEENEILFQRMGGQYSSDIDLNILKSLTNLYFSVDRKYSRKEVICVPILIHAISVGKDIDSIKYVAVADAISLRSESVRTGFSGKITSLISEDFVSAQVYELVRDPRATFASPRHQFVNSLDNMYALSPKNTISRFLSLISLDFEPDNGVIYLYWLIYLQRCAKVLERLQTCFGIKISTLRNEDLNLKFVPTMKSLSEELNIKNIWMSENFVPTVNGAPWRGAGAYNSNYQRFTNGILPNDSDNISSKVTGPNKYVTERWKRRLSAAEVYIIEYLFHNYFEKYGYSRRSKIPLNFIFFLLAVLFPFRGEPPSFKWIVQGFKESGYLGCNRIYYALVFPLFYISSRFVFILLVYFSDMFELRFRG